MTISYFQLKPWLVKATSRESRRVDKSVFCAETEMEIQCSGKLNWSNLAFLSKEALQRHWRLGGPFTCAVTLQVSVSWSQNGPVHGRPDGHALMFLSPSSSISPGTEMWCPSPPVTFSAIYFLDDVRGHSVLQQHFAPMFLLVKNCLNSLPKNSCLKTPLPSLPLQLFPSSICLPTQVGCSSLPDLVPHPWKLFR